MNQDIDEIRMLVSQLYCAAGCDCCRDTNEWNRAASVLAVKLGIPAYEDGSGFNFYKVRDEYKTYPTNKQ